MLTDFQSVKTTEKKGFDGGKNAKGGKPYVVVAFQELVLGLLAMEANTSERLVEISY